LRKFLTLVLLGILCFGEKVVLTRKNHAGQPEHELPIPNLQLKIEMPGGILTGAPGKFRNFDLFRQFGMKPPLKGRQHLKILVLKVEFVEDGDSSTTGSGKMDLVGFGTPDDGLFYDPPHTRSYFQHQLQFLSNYYKANSFGNCVVDYDVKPDNPIGNYQLPHKMKYYSGFIRLEYVGQYIIPVYNSYAMEMGMVRIVADAIAAADQDGSIDFSQYDDIIVFHAGTLWQISVNFARFDDIPSATIPPGAFEYYLGKSFFVVDGGSDTVECSVSLNSEMARVEDYMNGSLGTAVHEFGHILGLPDLYDVYYNSNGIGSWDLMDYGGWSGNPSVGAPYGSLPTGLSAWSRYFLGWVNPPSYHTPESLLTLRASEIDTTQYGVAGQTMIKIPISPTEYYLIENREQDIKQKDTIVVDVEGGVPVSVDYGEYDFFLPGSGILIWHVDDNVINANYAYNMIQIDPKHKGVDLEEADGIQHFDAFYNYDSLEYYGSSYDAFFIDDSGLANRHFGPFTNPNSDSYYGKSLTDIYINSWRDTMMNFSLDYDIYQPGFPVTVLRHNPPLATTYGDLDNDDNLEIVVITKSGYIYVFRATGALDKSRYFGPITTFPAVGDINGDSAEDIVFGSNLKLFALDGKTLDTLNGFPLLAQDCIVGAPLLFDINGDGALEIIFGSMDRRLYCLDKNGSAIAPFPLFLNTAILSTPCVFDQDAGTIGVLGSDGRFWLVNKQGVVREFTDSQHNLISYSSPVTGDMDRDGEPEAVIVNGYGTVYIYGADSLEEKFEIWIDSTMYYTPALADLDHDGYLEIISPNSTRTMFVSNRNGTSENNYPLYTGQNIQYPLLIVDIDSTDSREEIIYGLGPADSIASGTLEIINDRKQSSAYSPLFGEGGFSSPGAVFDLDHDGTLEIACTSDSGVLYVWDFPATRSSWRGYMNTTKNWGMFDGQYYPLIRSPFLLGNFYIYPSPVSRQGRVRFYLYHSADVQVDILDISGRKIGGIKPARVTANEYNEVEFDFTNESNGIYLVRIEVNSGGKREVKFKKFAVLK
jgi:M6 family metalloprotease-like protein